MLCRYVARVSQIGGCGPLDDALAVCESSAGYAPRNPAESVLYNVVAGDLENFLAGQRRRDRVVPRFVERELRKFLECGVLANGFLESSLRCLRTGSRRSLLMQGARDLLLLRREEDGRDRRSPRGSGSAGSSDPAVGAFFPRRPALPPGL